jgi:two-component system phosphate regulon sensor histidine kinase PhoR
MLAESKETKLKRLELSLREEMGWQASKARIAKKILKRKVEERTLDLQRKVEELRRVEIAMINILEDARELEVAIKEQRDRIQAIISSIVESLIVVKTDYKIALINPAAQELLEIAEEEAVGRNLGEFLKVVQGGEELGFSEWPVSRMFKTGKIVNIEVEDNVFYRLPSGKQFPVEITVAPLHGDGITAGIIVFRDITERRELNEAKSNFISIASHQLRTPLVSMRWYSEMLYAGDVGRLNKEQKDFVSHIYNSALKMNEVINLLLTMAKVESGQTETKTVKLDFYDFTRDVLKELEFQIKQKKLKVEVVTEGSLPEIEFNVSILRQVVTNLIANSIRYTPSGGRIEIKIDAKKLKRKKGEIVFSVKDNGIGIPEDAKEKIFTRFFRAENAKKKVPDGSGLGLSLVKSLVNFWGGRIWFESEEGKGTTFYFTAPVVGLNHKQ